MIRRCTICEFVVRFWDILTGIVTNYHQPHFFFCWTSGYCGKLLHLLVPVVFAFTSPLRDVCFGNWRFRGPTAVGRELAHLGNTMKQNCYETWWRLHHRLGVSYNGGTQQPWVFLLKMTILRCFGGTTIYGNTQIVMKIGGDFITICVLWSFSSHAVSKLIASPVEMAGGECLARDHVP